uniref:Uncharacterized protein n=1 Tax=Schistocephalus solidus TaxID=70667 RepID=A0A0X3PG59_SCHSO
MWIIYGVLLLSLEAVHCGWDYYGSIDTYFEPDFYISKMPMRNGVELYMQTKDFYRVLGVEVETAGKMKVDAEVNGNLIRIPNAPEYVCLNFRLEKDFFARRCIFLERLYGRIDMSFNLHIETLHNALQSYRIQWRASEDENFGILVYNTTHMKHLVQKTSFTELFYLRPGTTYVICVSSNVGRLQITCSTWKTNNWGLDTESMDSIKALPIPVQLEELGHTWAHIVWKPAKAYKRGLILAPEAYLLLAQQVGSNCPEQAIQVIQTAADEGVQETRSVVQAIKRAYFEPCMDINVIERHPHCSCSFKDRPVWIDGIPYRNIDRRNYSFELTINNLERNKVYNFTVIPLVPFFAVSTWLHMHVSVFGQTETKFHGNAVPSIFISVLCFFGVLGIIAYLAVGHYLHKKNRKRAQARCLTLWKQYLRR